MLADLLAANPTMTHERGSLLGCMGGSLTGSLLPSHRCGSHAGPDADRRTLVLVQCASAFASSGSDVVVEGRDVFTSQLAALGAGLVLARRLMLLCR